jgi:predicted ATPase
VYQVLQASGVQSRFEVYAARGLTPLVGREPEVGLLVERWARVKAGMGQVVVLEGEAGIGKSRLVQVLKDHVAKDAHTLLECRVLPYQQHTALYPVVDLLHRLLQWQPGTTPGKTFCQLTTFLSQYPLPLFSETTTTEPALLAYHALRGELWDKALAYFRQAGEQAVECSANREAVAAFEQALVALQHLPDSRDTHEQAIDLWLALCTALRPHGDFRPILACLREAESLATALDDPRCLGWVLIYLSDHFHQRGEDERWW